MKKSVGIALFLLLIGSLEARNRLTNDFDGAKTSSHKKVSATSKSKKSNLKHKSAKVHVTGHHAPKTLAGKKKHERKVKQQQKDAEAKRRKKQAKENQLSLNDAEFKGYSQAVGIGFKLYHKESKVEITDAANTNAVSTGLLTAANVSKDEIEVTKSKPTVQVSYALSRDYENLPSLFRAGEAVDAALGAEFTFAKRDDAYQGIYKDDPDADTHSLRTRQDIKQYTLKVFGEYGLFEYYGFKYNLKLATGMSVGALRDLRIFEYANNKHHFTGQRLEPNKTRPVFEFGLNITKSTDYVDLFFAYDVSYIKQTYKDELFIDTPDSSASDSHTNNYNNLRPDLVRHIVKVNPPEFKLWAFNFMFGFGLDFDLA